MGELRMLLRNNDSLDATRHRPAKEREPRRKLVPIASQSLPLLALGYLRVMFTVDDIDGTLERGSRNAARAS